MHVGGITVDRTWLLQLIFTLLVAAAVLHRLVKNTASKYFEVGANFEGGRSRRDEMSGAAAEGEAEPENRAVCAICGNPGNKKCSRCKSVRYCSSKCQEEHWKSGHKLKCKEYGKINSSVSASTSIEFKASSGTNRSFSGIALVLASGTNKSTKKPRDVLFPYDEFIKLYNWDKPGFPPCGLLNRGNSCFANVVLQCLTYTRPLVAYLLEKGHRRECRRNDWCFLCKFQEHVERVSQSSQAFSPLNILSCLPSFSGNLCYGKQEDAHEFMRIAIDTMQSVCLDEFGGEKAVPLSSQETTLIQHIFGGHLLSQVTCTECNKVSNQLENMMDLTVEIHGEVGSLEECLDQFTAKEWLHGDNMYKCDGCNDYVKACKRLTIQRAPNILTIALKRFRSGRFGKLNKRVTFPEMLDLSSYMSEDGDGSDVYKLYAVIVHLDMLNASFFGHYICYTKDFRGNWYRIDDCKVTTVALEEVLSQGAYMLLYSRVSVRPSCLKTVKPSEELQPMLKANFSSCTNETKECYSPLDLRAAQNPGSQAAESSSHSKDSALVNIVSDSVISNGLPTPENGSSGVDLGVMKPSGNIDASGSCSSAAIENLRCQNGAAFASTDRKQDPDPEVMNTFEPKPEPEPEPDSSTGTAVPMEVSDCEDDLCAGITAKADVMDDLFNAGRVNWESSPTAVKVNGTVTLPGEASSNSTRSHKLKREWPLHGLEADNGNGMKRAEISNDS